CGSDRCAPELTHTHTHTPSMHPPPHTHTHTHTSQHTTAAADPTLPSPSRCQCAMSYPHVGRGNQTCEVWRMRKDHGWLSVVFSKMVDPMRSLAEESMEVMH